MPLADRAFFKKDKDWWKKQKLREKIKWIRRAKIIMISYKRIGNESREVRLMRNYLLEPD